MSHKSPREYKVLENCTYSQLCSAIDDTIRENAVRNAIKEAETSPLIREVIVDVPLTSF